MKRPPIPTPMLRGLFHELDVCDSCGGFPFVWHHLLPGWAAIRRHLPGQITGKCTCCHDVGHAIAPLAKHVEHSQRRRAQRTTSELKHVTRLLIDGGCRPAVKYFVNSEINDSLIWLARYRDARDLLKRLMSESPRDRIDGFRIQLARAELGFWDGQYAESQLILENLESAVADVDVDDRARYLEVRAEILSVIASDRTLQGILHMGRCEEQEALDLFARSIEITRAKDRRDRLHSSHASSLIKIGKWDEAAAECQKIIADASGGAERYRSRSSNLDRLASIYRRKKNPDAALELLPTALMYALAANNTRGIAYRFRRFGEVFADLGHSERALTALRVAQVLSERFGDPNQSWIQEVMVEIEQKEKHAFAALNCEVSLHWRRQFLDLSNWIASKCDWAKLDAAP